MASRTVSKSKSVQGNTDLTLVAPIRQGLVDTVPPCTYASRLHTVLQTLHVMQAMSREYAPIRPFTDTVERIRAIHSFRLAILEPQQQFLLALTFDSGWEPYMRIVWSSLGPLLDLLLCNCDGYVTAYGNSYADYTDWVRRAQVETGLFYNEAPLTVDDLQYLRQAERGHETFPATPATDLAAAQTVIASPASVAQATAGLDPGDVGDRLALSALAALYGLAAMYPPQSPAGDGEILLRAARLILDDIGDTVTRFPEGSAGRLLFGNQLAWFEQGPVTPAPAPASAAPCSLSDVQGGILTSYDATHGALLLIAFEDAARAHAFLSTLKVTSEEHAAATAGALDEIYTNIAFTHEGLRQLGLSDPELGAFPQEFREGMAARSSILGDVRSNHPLNWILPQRNWTPAGRGAVIPLQIVHAVVLLSVRSSRAVPGDYEVVDNPYHPLFERVSALAQQLETQLLSVQTMRRHTKDGDSRPRDHFGFVDGLSQPNIVAAASSGVGKPWTNQTARGELLLGYPSDQGDDPLPTKNPLVSRGLWTNCTYLVVRKLGQDVEAFARVLDEGSIQCKLPTADLTAKMMGRTQDGAPLVSGAGPDSNSFDYRGDPTGSQCPFQAHIRRANPRDPSRRLVPRIMRRGMSYGPRYGDSKDADRGLVFMAYNARIAEQFEMIQRWLAGGNSSGGFSGQSDPFLGVPQLGDPRTFRFQHNGSVQRMVLDDPAGRPLVTLRWGTYLFVPSIAALGVLTGTAKAAAPREEVTWSPEAGEQVIQRLVALEARGTPDMQVHWKAVLEDPAARLAHVTASVWAAIRERHGGVLRTPYGVLVGSYQLVMQVLRNPDTRYSVRGYAERMRDSFGEAYLGLDEGAEYEAQSAAVNQALMEVSEADAFARAHTTTQKFLGVYFDQARQYFKAQHAAAWELTLDMGDLFDSVLSALCTAWFGIGDGGPDLESGGWSWDWKGPSATTARCPGTFLAPARFLFQPNPGPMEREFGIAHGQTLRAAFHDLVVQGRKSPPSGPLAKALIRAFPDSSQDDLLERTLIGVLVGFLPVVGASLRACLFEWIQDGTLWELQEALPPGGEPSYEDVHALMDDRMRRTMQRSEVPEVVWRTAITEHALGGVDVHPGEMVVVGLGSAAQEALQAGTIDCSPLFGGDRRVAPHPTHACPAYAMGMGVVLGTLVATIASRPKRPGPAPLALTWGGAVS